MVAFLGTGAHDGGGTLGPKAEATGACVCVCVCVVRTRHLAFLEAAIKQHTDFDQIPASHLNNEPRPTGVRKPGGT